LTIEDPQSLGQDLLHGGSTQSQALVNHVGGETGTLQLLDPNFATDGGGFTVRDEPLTLNGPGVNNLGALTNLEGDNNWAGNVTLGSPTPNGSDVSIGVSAAPASAASVIKSASETGTTVTITTASAHPFQTGQLVNIAGVSVNGYNGIFTITSVPTSTSFTYTSPLAGLGGGGSGTASLSSLIISGVIGDVAAGSGPFNLTKVDAEELIFNNANTYAGATSVQTGVLDVRDSQALGTAGKISPVFVSPGASLDLEVDTGFDAHGRNLANDSITGVSANGPQLGMTFDYSLSLIGAGFMNTGALRSISGINIWTGSISLVGTVSIGVDPDPHPSSDNTYFTHDYSLTVSPLVPAGEPNGPGILTGNSLLKVNLGHLILPTPNSYTGTTEIQNGWVSINHPKSLGNLPITGIGDTLQPFVQVDSGAALHLLARLPLGIAGATESGSTVTITTSKAHPYAVGDQVQISGVGVAGYNGTFTVTEVPSPTSFTYADSQTGLAPSGGGVVTGNYTLNRILHLSGVGIVHPFGLISQKGALMDLSGGNIASGIIQLLGTTGIGVEQVFPVSPAPPALLTLTNQVTDSPLGPGGLTKFGSGRLIIQGDGNYSAANDVAEGSLRIENDTALGRETTGTSNGTNIFTTTATTVNAGADLELASDVAPLNGGIAAGIQVYDEHLILNGPGQQVSISGSSGTFQLTFAGSQTPALNINDPTLAADMQTALDTLPSIANAGGFVTVTKGTGPLGNVYTVVFGGLLLEANNPLMTVTTSPLPDNATIVISGTTSGTNGSLNSPLLNLNSDNMWRGPVTLNTSAPIDVMPNSRLSLLGAIDDSGNPSANGSDLIKLDGGELVLGGANSFRGVMHVGLSTALGDAVNLPGGLLTIENSQALGATAAGASVIANSSAGATESGSTVTITTTAAHNFTAGQEVQIAGVGVAGYNGLFIISSIPSPSTFTYTDTQTGLAASGGGSATGYGGTEVANSSTMQIQGNVTVAGEPLSIQGTGVGAPPTNLPIRWFNAGPGPMNNGQTPGNEAVSGRVTGVATDPTDPNIIYIATAGGGAWKTQNNGLTWQQMFDSASIQTLSLPSGPGKFTLTFAYGGNSASTPPLDLSSPILVQDIQLALNNLSTIGGLTPVPASVTVTQSTVDRLLFNIVFAGALSGIDLPLLSANGIGTTSSPAVTGPTGVGSYNGMFTIASVPNPMTFTYTAPVTSLIASGGGTATVGGQTVQVVPSGNNGAFELGTTVTIHTTTAHGFTVGQTVQLVGVGGGNPAAALYTGAIAVDPNDPHIVYLGTGEVDNSVDSFYGTGVYVSRDGGHTWSLLTASGGANPLYGLAISKIVVDPGPPNAIPFTPQTPNSATLGNQPRVTPTGRIYVATSDLATNTPVRTATTPEVPGVYRFDTSTTQVQTITLPTLSGNGTFTLTFNGAPTIALHYNSPTLASDIQNALNTLPTIGGPGAAADIAASPNGATESGTTVTITTSTPHGFGVGERVVIVGVGVAGYNGQFFITSVPSATSFTYTDAAVGLAASGGGSAANVVPGGVVFVTQSPINPLVFNVAFEGIGLLVQANLNPTPGTNFLNPVDLPLYPQLMSATGAVVTPASTWVNLTDAVDMGRATQLGQGGVPPPKTPGPEDDFRMSFPQRGATWSDLTLAYLDPTNPATGTLPSPGDNPGDGILTPVLYAALGTAGGSGNNAVYRTEQPQLAPESTLPTLWYVGDQGAQRDEVQQIAVNNWADPAGSYQLEFQADDTDTEPDPPGDTDADGDNDTTIVLPAATDATTLQDALNQLPDMANEARGSVRVTLASASATQLVFNVEWLGQMANTPFPTIEVLGTPTGTTTVNIGETQHGSGIDNRTSEFPAGNNGGMTAGNIKITSFVSTNFVGDFDDVFTAGFNFPAFSQVTLYAAVSTPAGALLAVDTSATGGKGWTAVTPGQDYLTTMGGFASSIIMANPTTVYVGGQAILETTNGGGAWADISVGANGNGPHAGSHAMWLDSQGRLVVGTDGGIWRLENATPGSILWNDINGDLSTSLSNGISANPNDYTIALTGSQNDGVDRFSGDTNWKQVIANSGGQVHFDPLNPLNAYAIDSLALNKSTDGGNTWSPVNSLNSQLLNVLDFKVDSVNSARLLAGGIGGADSLYETLNGGASWTGILNTPLAPVTALALATYQGNFVADTGFPLVTDTGANTYDPNTIYISNGTALAVTKNHGQSWAVRTPPLGPNTFIQALTVDPGNRDTIYLVTNSFVGTAALGRVWKSTNAGLNWTDISAGLPDLPAWTVAVDPRTDSPTALGQATVYIGNDNGVWQLLPGGTWTRFASGMPSVQVHYLELNQALNTLTAGTYGRSMYQFFLSTVPSDTPPVYGVLRTASGSSQWTGPIYLVGAGNTPATNQVFISAEGSQTVQNGISAAQLNILGPVSDLVLGSNPALDKFGQGNIILSGANSYGGVTEIKEGALTVNNALALGGTNISEVQTLTFNPPAPTTFNLNFNNAPTPASFTYTGGAGDLANLITALDSLSTIPPGTPANPTLNVTQSGNVFTITFNGILSGFLQPLITATATAGTGTATVSLVTPGAGGTIVDPGTSLQLQSDLALETVQLNGDGFLFNNHYHGALRNLSGSNTFTGTLVLNTNSTIGVDTGTFLTIGAKSTLPGNSVGTITDGGTRKNLTKESTGTLVLASPDTYGGATSVVANIAPSPTGATKSGSVVTITTTSPHDFTAGQTVQISGVANSSYNGTYIITSVPSATTFTYTGTGLGNSGGGTATAAPTTLVNQGALQIQNSQALSSSTTEVKDGAQLQLQSPPTQTITVTGTTGTFTLSFNGKSTAALPVGSTAFQIQTALSALSTIGGVDASVAVSLSGNVYTVAFQGSLGTAEQPPLVATATGGATAVVATGVGTPVVVTGEPLTLSGTGIFGTGALLDTGGNNTWQGSIALARNPVFLVGVTPPTPATTPPTQVWIGVSNPTDTLTINGVISSNGTLGLGKVGLGRVTFAQATQGNTYTGPTTVLAGALRIQTVGTPLGASGIPTVVNNGAALELDGDPTNAGKSITVTQAVVLNGYGPAAIQLVALSMTSGTFTLSFNGSTTGSLSFNSPTLATDMQTALNNLTSIRGVAGSVTVTKVASGYLVMFGGALATFAVPLLTGSSGVAISSVLAGGQGALRNVSGNNVYNSAITLQTSPVNLTTAIVNSPNGAVEAGSTVTITTLGAHPFTAGETIRILGVAVSGYNGLFTITSVPSPTTFTYADTQTGLAASGGGTATVAGALIGTAIGVDAGLTLTEGPNSVVQDFGPLTVPAATLTKVGAGTLVFPIANTYSGTTFVNNGVLNIGQAGANSSALGGGGPEQQTVTVLGANGIFNLSFNGFTTTTPTLFVGDPTLAQDMQTALNSLPSIGGVGGSVTVMQGSGGNSNVFTVAFGGSLQYTNVPPMTSTTLSGGVTAVVATLRDGPGGTVVNSGGTLQVQGNINVSTENLTLNGTGFNGQGALENVSGSNTWNSPITLGSNTLIGVDSLGTGNNLTISQAIGDAGRNFGVTKTGPGTLVYSGGISFGVVTSNTYTGLTTVQDGVLQLNKMAGASLTAGIASATESGSTVTITTTTAHNFIPGQVVQIAGVGVAGYNGLFTITSTPSLTTFTYTATQTGLASSGGGTATVSAVAISGPVLVGDSGNAPGTDLLQLEQNNQLVSTSAVSITSDGELDVNGKTQTIGSLNMTGGIVDLHGGQLALGGNVTATADASGNPAVIQDTAGGGSLSLGGATRTFTVNAPATPTGKPALFISAVISGTSGEGLTVAGTGTLQLFNHETYTGVSTVNSGDLQVDGSLGPIGGPFSPVSLAGGSLNGNGSVGAVTSSAPVAPSNASTLAMGDSSPGNISPGILTVQGNVALNAQTNFFFELDGDNIGVGPGFSSQLMVNGTVNLGGAVLTGVLDSGYQPAVGHSWVILQSTGAISGQFAQGGNNATFFLGNIKFLVTIANNGATNTVTLTREALNTTTSVAVAPASGVPNTSYTITATVTPEAGATGPTPGQVNITVTGPNSFNQSFSPTVVFNSATGLNTASVTLQGLNVGTYTIASATYVSSDPTINGSSAPTMPAFMVSQDGTTTSAVSLVAPNNASPSFYGQLLTFQATVAPNTSGPLLPTGSVTFLANGTSLGTVPLVNNGGVLTATLTTGGTPAGNDAITASYGGDSSYTASTSATALAQVVNKAVTTTDPVASSLNPATFGLSVTFSTQVHVSSPGVGPAVGTVTFVDNLTAQTIGTGTLDGTGTATFTTSTLPAGSYQITATYSGNSNFVGSSSPSNLPLMQTINPAVTLSPSSLPADTINIAYNQTITASAGTGNKSLVVSNIQNAIAGLTIPGSGTNAITISGTPTASGTETFTVTATDTLGASTQVNYSITVNAAVTLSPSSVPGGVLGVAYNQTITASGGTGNKSLVVSNVQNPIAGLTIPSGGTNAIAITGTPTAAGTETFTVTATDQVGGTTHINYSLTVLMFTPTSLPADNINIAYNQTITVTGSTSNVNLVVSNIQNPVAGLNLPASGTNAITITGTPTATGTETFTLTATDQAGNTAQANYSITVNPAVTLGPSSLPADTINIAYNQTITASGGTGNKGLVVSNLQNAIAGLTLPGSGTNAITIAGTPTATGTETFTVTATDQIGATTQTNYSITVNPAVTLGPSSLPADTINIAYNQTITASGGTGNKGLVVSNLQNAIAGLTLPGSGTNAITIAGTPTATGTETFTVTATDQVGATTQTNYSITVNPAVTLSPSSLPADTINIAYNQTITASGGTGNKGLVVSNLQNPIAGLTLPGSGTNAIAIAGTPTAAGTETFTVTATDQVGAKTQTNYSITVNPAVTLTPSSLPADTINIAYNQTITASGGTGNKSLIVSNLQNAIAGLTLPGSGTNPITIAGTPTATGTETFTVTVTDQVGAKTQTNYSITVNPAVTLTPSSLPADTINIAYNQTITAPAGTGNKNLVVSNIQNAIAGLTIPASGTNAITITGTPTATGTETFTVTATDQVGATTQTNYSITVNPAVTLSPSSLLADTINIAYNQTITASGGTGNKNLVVSNIQNAIAGLTIPAGGTNAIAIMGTPTAAGTETFTVTATDQVGATTHINYSLTVLAFTPTSLPADTISIAYNATITVTGSTSNVNLVVSNIQNPVAGLSLPASGTNAITITGTPTATGTETFTLTATDQAGNTAQANYSITINPAPTLSPTSLPAGIFYSSYNQTITASGGTGNKSLVVSNVQNPIAGLTIPGSGTNAITITGAPTATGTETFTVTATDQTGATGQANYSITVKPATVMIGGVVFQDTNLDGTQDNTEGGIAGVTLFLDLDGSGVLKPADPTTVTDTPGHFQFAVLSPGTYTIRELLYGGVLLNAPRSGSYQVTVNSGANVTGLNFADVPTSITLPLTLPLTSPFPKQGNANADYVEALYRAELARNADPSGLAHWTGLLNSGQATRLQVAAGIRISQEHFTDEVTDFYFTILNRAPDAAGLQSWVTLLQNGMPEEQVAVSFLNSPEYLSKGDKYFVDHMYNAILGRVFDPSGEAQWLDLLGDDTSGNPTHPATLTHAQVITDFLYSPESLNRLIQGYYQIFLQRLADPAGLDHWYTQLSLGGKFSSIAEGFLASDEFYNNAAAQG